MASYKLLMPKMGESVIEATILSWNKKVGDNIAINDVVLEVATDKVDTEVPSEVAGILQSILFEEGSVVAVGEALAIIETENDFESLDLQSIKQEKNEITENKIKTELTSNQEEKNRKEEQIVAEKLVPLEYNDEQQKIHSNTNFSPLVLNIAKVENISLDELNSIVGTGLDNRVTKQDILNYIANKKTNKPQSTNTITTNKQTISHEDKITEPIIVKNEFKEIDSNAQEIVEMDRVRKIIAKNMIDSRKTSAHVSSFVECDVTKIVKWREKHKNNFKQKYGYSLTYLPVMIEAIAQSIKEFPNINISLSNEKIIYKKDINIGIATALPNGNLIVPVIKNADRKNILGLASEINELANKARNNNLSADDISNGTYTVSNIGTFGNIIGTPIILQPQVAIMAIGLAVKKPVVIEINGDDVIAIRHMMFLSHTYDHRIVDGMLGGKFVKRVAEILENFDDTQEI